MSFVSYHLNKLVTDYLGGMLLIGGCKLLKGYI